MEISRLIFALVITVPTATPSLSFDLAKGLKEVGKGLSGAIDGFADSVDKVGKEIHKGLNNTAEAIVDGIENVGEFVDDTVDDIDRELKEENFGKELKQAGKDFGNSVDDAWKKLNDFAEWICEDVINAQDGDCSACYTSDRGDGKGSVYACEGGDPNKGQPSKSPIDDSPTDDQLAELERWAKATRITHQEYQPWSDGSDRFFSGKVVLGRPIPDFMNVLSPTGRDEIRTIDGPGKNYGIGSFLAPRAVYDKAGNRVGTRFHGGVDFVSVPGEPVQAPISGRIVRMNYAYAQDHHGLRAIILTAQGYEVKVLYVEPDVDLKVGDYVLGGSKIGRAQDLSKKFGKSMTNHIHLTVVDPDGKIVSPDAKYTIKPSD